jgi:predicted CopG family antitoxin
MAKTRTTLTIDEDVFRAVRLKAARTGKRDSEVIEESLRRDLRVNALKEIWAKVNPASSEDEALQLANAELHAMRDEEKLEAGRP